MTVIIRGIEKIVLHIQEPELLQVKFYSLMAQERASSRPRAQKSNRSGQIITTKPPRSPEMVV